MSDEFISKLTDVLQYLLQVKKQLPDDTCLQRLLDVIQINVREDTAESSELISFIKEVTTKIDDIQPSVLTFSLHLCGNLVKNENVYKKFKDVTDNLLKQVQHLLNDSSIGTAYFTVLSNIICHETGIVCFCEKTDNIEMALERMKYGESVFLKAAASKMIKVLLMSPYSSSIPEIINNLLDSLFKELGSLTFSNINYSKCLLSLFHELGSSIFFSSGFTRDYILGVLKSCLKLSLMSPTVIVSMVLDVIKSGLISVNMEDRNIFMKEVVIELNTLAVTDLVRAHKLACCLYKFCSDLNVLINLPMNILFEKDTNLFGKDQILTKPMVTTLILQSVSCHTQQDKMYEQLNDTIKILKLIQGMPEDCLSLYKPYLLNNNRLLGKILQCLHCKLESLGRLRGEYCSQLFNLLLDTASLILTDQQIYKHCMNCILLLLMSNDSLDLTKLIKLLEAKLCDIKWEVRDTTLEIINQLITVIKDTSKYEVLISLCHLSWLSLADGNSYVRASVISVLASIARNKQLFEKFLATIDSKLGDVVQKLVNILKDDSEAFARRSAVKALQELYQYVQVENSCQCVVRSAILNSMNDFDWEVKILVLEFWEYWVLSVVERQIKECVSHLSSNGKLPVYAAELTSKLEDDKSNDLNTQIRFCVNAEFYETLFLGYNDYEQSVSEKASVMIKTYFKLWDDICKLHDQLNVEESENGLDSDIKSWIKKLKILDVDSKLGNCDEYNKNPVSLLDDILATAEEEDEENFVDCY